MRNKLRKFIENLNTRLKSTSPFQQVISDSSLVLTFERQLLGSLWLDKYLFFVRALLRCYIENNPGKFNDLCSA